MIKLIMIWRIIYTIAIHRIWSGITGECDKLLDGSVPEIESSTPAQGTSLIVFMHNTRIVLIRK